LDGQAERRSRCSHVIERRSTVTETTDIPASPVGMVITSELTDEEHR